MMNRPPLQQQVTFLYTADLGATAVFYHDILGLPLVLDQEACHIYQVTPQAFIGFCHHLSVPDKTAGVILTLVSDDVDGWYAYLQQFDLPIEKPPTLYAKFNIYHLFVRDPNGYLVEIQRFLDPSWPKPTLNPLP